MKPGWNSSEFWLSLTAVVIGATIASGLFEEGSTAMRIAGIASVTLAALGYTSARTSLKKKGGAP